MTTKQKGLLLDITRCIGCGECSTRCKQVNVLPEKLDPKLTSDTWTVVKEIEGNHVRNLCRHCKDATCVSVCPVGALYKSDLGAVIYDKSICLGCRYCMVACPYHVPTFEWYSATPRIRKCILCEPRIREGKTTGCAEACPTEATIFGDHDTLVEIAKARIKANPKEYHDHIYGLDELGGSLVMFLSPVPFIDLGFEMFKDFPPSDRTWQVLKTVPSVFTGVGLLMGGCYFMFKRRQAVAAANAAKTQTKEGDNE